MAKTDQSGFFEQHAEKIALAVAAALMVYLLATKVFHSPHSTTEIGPTNEAVQPADMDTALAQEAKHVAQAIERREETPEPLDDKVAELQAKATNNIPAQIQAGRLPRVINLTEGGPALTLVDGPIGGSKIESLSPMPALQEIQVWTGPELAFPSSDADPTAAEPKELSVAHVTAVLDYETMTQTWTRELKASGLPLEILFVRVSAERQTRQADGTWSPATKVDDVRVSTALADLPAYDPANPQALTAAVNALRQPGAQEALLQPGYHQIYWPEAKAFGPWMHHLPWTSVSDLSTAAVRPDQIQPTPVILESKTVAPTARPTRRTPRRNRNVGASPGADLTPPAFGGAGPGAPPTFTPGMTAAPGGGGGVYGGGGGGGVYGGGGGGGRAAPTRRPTAAREDPAIARAKASLSAGQKALDKAKELESHKKYDEAARQYAIAARSLELANQQNIPGARPLLTEAQMAVAKTGLPHPTPVPSLGNMCKEGKVQLWIHDTDCRPGAVYRYRLRVEMLNPLLDWPIAPGTPAEDLPPLTMASESDWSAPAAMPARTEFFFVGDRPADGAVEATIFRRTMGQVLAEKVAVAPGQTIGAVATKSYLLAGSNPPVSEEKEVDFATGCVVVDCIFDKTVATTGATRKTAEVTVLTPTGELVTRTVAADKSSPAYSRLRKENQQALSELKKVDAAP